MTKQQEKAIKKIEELAKELLYGEEYEIKRFDIEELNDKFVEVVVETGMKNDSGTYAAIFCRDRAQLFVGKRGGVTYICANKRGKIVSRRFKGYSLLQAVCDQR